VIIYTAHPNSSHESVGHVVGFVILRVLKMGTSEYRSALQRVGCASGVCYCRCRCCCVHAPHHLTQRTHPTDPFNPPTFTNPAVGFLMGYAFGFLTRMMLRVMRRFGAGRDQEVALTLAMAYLAYWVTSSPCQGSGVVAVAVMGLYGAAKNKW